jgi:heat shock protein HslJ
MHQRKNLSLSKLFFSFTILSSVIPVLAQQTSAQDSWLDRPLVNWNKQSGTLPQPPQPSVAQGESADTNRCRQQVRQPASAAEKALVRSGWMPYGRVYNYDLTRIVMALSGFDGMCRPLGFQAFLYWKGSYAGTLSPVPMNSRMDGALTNIRLLSATNISSDFVRYKESDALCCPSRISTVVYNLRRDDIPILVPTEVTSRATSQISELAETGSEQRAITLFGKRWTLIEMEDRRFSAGEPYIEIDGDQKRVSGSSGCNRLTGTFEIVGATLKLSRLASTRRACVDAEVQRVETRFLNLLETTTRFEVQGNTLRLYANARSALLFASK